MIIEHNEVKHSIRPWSWVLMVDCKTICLKQIMLSHWLTNNRFYLWDEDEEDKQYKLCILVLHLEKKEKKKTTLPTDNDNIHSSQVVHLLDYDVFGFEDIFVATDQTFIDFCHHSFWFEWFWINLIYKFEFFICVKKELNGSFYFFQLLF